MADPGPEDLERYKAEFATIDQQIATLTERRRALGQLIDGLESLFGTAAGSRLLVSEARPVRRLELDARRSHVANAVNVLRYYGRVLNATQIAETFGQHGIRIKPNTLYRALRRRPAQGHVVPHYPGFGLPEWEQLS
jgi:DNA-directed RNA polymerase beta' subunit